MAAPTVGIRLSGAIQRALQVPGNPIHYNLLRSTWLQGRNFGNQFTIFQGVLHNAFEFYFGAPLEPASPIQYQNWTQAVQNAVLAELLTIQVPNNLLGARLGTPTLRVPNALHGLPPNTQIYGQAIIRGRARNGPYGPLIAGVQTYRVTNYNLIYDGTQPANPVQAANCQQIAQDLMDLLIDYDPDNANPLAVGSNFNQYLVIDNTTRLELRFVFGNSNSRVPGGKRTPILTFSDRESLYRKKSLIKVPEDGNCAIRAAIIGRAVALHLPESTLINLKESHLNQPYVNAFLSRYPQYQVGQDFETLDELFDALSFFTMTSIMVFDVATFFNCIYRTPQPFHYADDTHHFNEVIFLMYDAGHVSVIRNILGFFDAKNFCLVCARAYNNIHHRCTPEMCQHCRTVHMPLFEETKAQNCLECGRVDLSAHCYEKHISNRVCQQTRYCAVCERVYSRTTEHSCDKRMCRTCYKYVDRDHKCFIQRMKLKNVDDSPRYLTFDFECDQSSGTHTVMYVESYDWVQEETHTHDDIEEFCAFLFTSAFTDYTCIAHNGRGYDFQFILNYCLRSGIKPKVIKQGQKIMYMEIPAFGLRFVDSLNFLPMGLSEFTKTFDLEELKKGFFPHWFNTAENRHYVGPYPPTDTYGAPFMTSKKAAEFKTWYEEVTSDPEAVFDFDAELRAYCHSDVELLTQGLKKFRALFIEECSFDPFQSITMASLCMKIYRTHHLPVDTLASLSHYELEFIRQAFYGGRVDACKLLADFTETPAVYAKYIDVNSLYPYVNTAKLYPKGHPVWIYPPQFQTHDLHSLLTRYRGIYEVDVTCNTTLYHPLLPERKEGKLLFGLAPKTKVCYTSIELQKAVSLGYVITHVYRILHWGEWTTELFASYMHTFHTMKQTATENKNNGLRTISKLCLNSLWGKFNENLDRRETDYVTAFEDVWGHLSNPEQEIAGVDVMGDNMYEVVFRHRSKKHWSQPSNKLNTAIGAFTTAYARLHLYEALELLQRQVLYYDTDSVIYACGDPERFGSDVRAPEGNDLGQWKDELNGGHINFFMSGGPKNYYYETTAGKVDMKIKGIFLNTITKEVLTRQVMEDIIQGNLDKVLTPEEQRITRTKAHELQNVAFSKVYQLTMTKRVQVPSPPEARLIDTLPFGFSFLSAEEDEELEAGLLDMEE